ncbi:hypothetical protein OR16_04362 [Cupriavidus basilensis OR16]|uniref:SprT-like domain-containing protein n=1 Tax=Cupriavidus basilensis OR16 TaxID=1127483 RepID=H1RZW6_9BURK|nr:SprT-like domain-containing protein [Cupriavidus basilensis]EHP44182.1 hypothetical protein OR16_04362 [Cupriavidus basilensis OR16]
MTPPIRTRWISATDELYAELEHAYRYFNERLFNNELPGCLFTLQRKRNTFGYYGPSRFLRRDARGKSDEIALNPAFFAFRTVEKTLSTLVHEMVHQWQAHAGKPSRNGYHNREWADKMESMGLMPSDTGAPDGNRVGQRMTHYILPGGPFDEACQALVASEILISWVDVQAQTDPMAIQFAVEPAGASIPTTDVDVDVDVDVEALTALGLRVDEDDQGKKRKTKYTCPGCGINVWGKAALRLGCLACDNTLDANTIESTHA